jgi:hypothetical protein
VRDGREREWMNKRLVKRHKLQVSRARERVRLSEPDLRTPEQLAAAREASREVSGRRAGLQPYYSAKSPNSAALAAPPTAAKAEVAS